MKINEENDLMLGVFSLIVGWGITAMSTYVNGVDGIVDHVWPLILGLNVATFGMTRGHVVLEADRIRKGAHFWIWFIRGIFLAGITLAVYQRIDWLYILITVNQWALFAVVFDPLLNKEKQRSWDYHGEESWWDGIYKENPKLWFGIEVAAYLATGAAVFIIA